MIDRSGQFVNWGRNQRCRPAAVEHPADEDDVAAIVKAAAAAGQSVKAVGTGHSFTDIACTDGRLLSLERLDRVIALDEASRRVTVGAGTTIARLNEELAARGLAVPNLGDIGYQAVAGALSTSTHGTGIRLGGLATQLAGFELVTAEGSLLRCSDTEEPEVFAAGRVSLGALGILTSLTLQCVPAFNLDARERPENIDEVLDGLDEHIEGNDHFELYWFPHTDIAYTKRNNRTDEPPRPKSRTSAFLNDVVISNGLLEIACRVGRARPSWIPAIARRATSALGRSRVIDRSDRVFTSPRYVRFVEMEYSIPRSEGANALREIRAFIARDGLNISFPVEMRFTAGDDIPLSTASGRESCYIAVHVFVGMRFEPYFRGVESIMTAFGGRPHWGKMHYQSADDLRPRYPQWDRFQALRARLDPDGRFSNTYLDRVLGPVAS